MNNTAQPTTATTKQEYTLCKQCASADNKSRAPNKWFSESTKMMMMIQSISVLLLARTVSRRAASNAENTHTHTHFTWSFREDMYHFR